MVLGCGTVVSRYMAWTHCGNHHFPESGSRWDGTDSKNWDFFFQVNERLTGGVGVFICLKKANRPYLETIILNFFSGACTVPQVPLTSP